MRFSASRLRTWQTCPLQAAFKYEKKLPELMSGKASFGIIIHHCIEQYLTGITNYEETVDLFDDLWTNPEKLNCEPDYWPKYTSYSSLSKKGREVLASFHEENQWAKSNLLASEHKFLVPFGDYELMGYVDLVQVKRGAVVLTDFKTSSRKPRISQLKLDIQFTVYIYAASQPEFWLGNGEDFPPMERGDEYWHKYKDKPIKGEWFHLYSNSTISTGGRDDDDYMRLYRLCKEIERASDNNIYVPKIGEQCLWCSFRDPCKMNIPDRDILESEPELEFGEYAI